MDCDGDEDVGVDVFQFLNGFSLQEMPKELPKTVDDFQFLNGFSHGYEGS